MRVCYVSMQVTWYCCVWVLSLDVPCRVRVVALLLSGVGWWLKPVDEILWRQLRALNLFQLIRYCCIVKCCINNCRLDSIASLFITSLHLGFPDTKVQKNINNAEVWCVLLSVVFCCAVVVRNYLWLYVNDKLSAIALYWSGLFQGWDLYFCEVRLKLWRAYSSKLDLRYGCVDVQPMCLLLA